jgi:hypothetical protein
VLEHGTIAVGDLVMVAVSSAADHALPAREYTADRRAPRHENPGSQALIVRNGCEVRVVLVNKGPKGDGPRTYEEIESSQALNVRLD